VPHITEMPPLPKAPGFWEVVLQEYRFWGKPGIGL